MRKNICNYLKIYVCLFVLILTGCSSDDKKNISYDQVGREYVSEYLNQVYCEDTSFDFSVVKGTIDSGDKVDSSVVSSKYRVDDKEYTVFVNVDTMKVYNNYYKADIENAIKELLISKISEQNLDIDLNGYNIEYTIDLNCNSTQGDNNNSSITVCLTDVYLSDITPVNVNDYMEDAFKSCFVEEIDESNYILNGKDESIRIYK